MQHVLKMVAQRRLVPFGALLFLLALVALTGGALMPAQTSADQLTPHLTIAAGRTGGEAIPGGMLQITPAATVGANVAVTLATSGGYTSLNIAATNGAKASGKPVSVCINARCLTYALDSGGGASATITPWGGIR
jgi:hypothetical protein